MCSFSSFYFVGETTTPKSASTDVLRWQTTTPCDVIRSRDDQHSRVATRRDRSRSRLPTVAGDRISKGSQIWIQSASDWHEMRQI